MSSLEAAMLRTRRALSSHSSRTSIRARALGKHTHILSTPVEKREQAWRGEHREARVGFARPAPPGPRLELGAASYLEGPGGGVFRDRHGRDRPHKARSCRNISSPATQR